MRRFLMVPSALAAALGAALLIAPAAHAALDRSSTRIDSVERRAQGERVLVNLSYLCQAGASIQVVVTVTAVNGDRIAQGTRQKRAECTGGWAPLQLRITRDLAGATFTVGQATARTVRTVCAGAECETIPYDETIRISRSGE